MSNNAASNVIAMREFDRPVPSQQAAQFERLLKECHELAVDRLSRSVATMLDKVEDTLWGLANQAMDRELRDVYIHVKDLALAKRKRIESEFRADYLAEFESRTRRDKKPKEAFSQFELGSLELGLVNDEDLEETLKVNNMATKLRRYCDEELAALDQRIGVLLGDATLQGETNPFSPQAICNAFKQTCRSLEPNLKARLILHKLFDDHVLDDIRPIFKDLNTLLVERSILPKIRYGFARGAGAGLIGPRAPGGVPLPGAPAPLAGMALHGADASGAGEQDMFAMLQNLVARNFAGSAGRAGVPASGVPGGVPGAGAALPGGLPGGAPGFALGIPGNAAGAGIGGSMPVAPGLAGALGAGAASAGVMQVPGFPPIMGGAAGAAVAGPAVAGPIRILQGAELLGSLTRIQHGDVSVVAGGNLPLAATLVEPGTTNVLRELKGTSLGSGMAQMDSMTLDIVAMLFDQIFGDERIPSAMKGLIGRLQIPMLKVAILDKNFFSKKTHPARRLLDVLGEIAVGMNAEFDQSSPLYKQIDSVVQKLVDGFQDSMDVFDPLREELEAFVAEENRRAEEEAKINARRIEHREKLEIAKGVAQQEILQRAKSGTIPRAVLKFLAELWVKLLLVSHAKHGAESDAWKNAVETMDLLIWSVNAKQTLEERRRLAGMLPGLLKRLNTGLQTVSADDDTRKRFFVKLMRCHTKVMNSAAATNPAASGMPAQAAAPRTPPTAPAADHRPPALTEAVAAHAPSLDVDHQPSSAPEAAAPGATAPASGLAVPVLVDEDTEPDAAPPEFTAVTIQNPFGEGEIEVEEISMSDLPPGAGFASSSEPAGSGDEHSRLVHRLKEGAWVEFRDDDDNRRPARLSYISPLKGTYLFVNRQGKKVGEYSVYQLAREFRTGSASILDAVPLFDRAMGSLVGALRASTAVQ